MRLPILKFAIAALLVCSDTVLAKITPAQVRAEIGGLEKKMNLMGYAAADAAPTAPFPEPGKGKYEWFFKLFEELIKAGNASNLSMKDMSPVTASADASTIFQAFEEFYRTYARLLGQLDLNADVRGATSHGENMVFCLTRYKTIIETMTKTLSKADESHAADMKKHAEKISPIFERVIDGFTHRRPTVPKIGKV